MVLTYAISASFRHQHRVVGKRIADTSAVPLIIGEDVTCVGTSLLSACHATFRFVECCVPVLTQDATKFQCSQINNSIVN